MKFMIFLIAAIVNVLLYMYHYWFFRKRYSIRNSWSSGTIGFGVGMIFYRLPEVIYGFPVDQGMLWTGIFICFAGVVMYVINRYSRKVV